MKNLIFVYTDFLKINLIEELFVNFRILNLDLKSSNINKFTYENLLIITKKKPPNFVFESENNTNHIMYVCLDKQFNKPNNISQNENVKFVPIPIKINRLKNLAEGFFNKKTINFNDFQLVEEKIINKKNNKYCNLTHIENKIILELINNKKIDRDYFLETILNLNKETETKTIESHLTRIRKKLYQIESNVRISSKENIFFLEFPF